MGGHWHRSNLNRNDQGGVKFLSIISPFLRFKTIDNDFEDSLFCVCRIRPLTISSMIDQLDVFFYRFGAGMYWSIIANEESNNYKSSENRFSWTGLRICWQLIYAIVKSVKYEETVWFSLLMVVQIIKLPCCCHIEAIENLMTITKSNVIKLTTVLWQRMTKSDDHDATTQFSLVPSINQVVQCVHVVGSLPRDSLARR